MKTRLTLDRFEGHDKEIAVLVAEDGRVVNIPHDFLPRTAQGGDVLVLAIKRDLKATRELPGIGPTLARRIIARRPFSTVEDLIDVGGIGEKKLAELRPLVEARQP